MDDGRDHDVRPLLHGERPAGCVSCGSHLATSWSTPDGAALLCRECAVLHGLGCP